jgi:outer membrane protein assembly factor BamA
MFRWALAFLAVAAAPLCGQTAGKRTPAKRPAAAKPAAPAPAVPKPPADKWPIGKLAVQGNRHYPSEAILAAAGLKTGQLAGQAEFEAARERLVATGLFESVGYRFGPEAGSNAFAATFEVVEVEPLYPVRFDRIELPEEELRQWMRARDPLFQDRIPATKDVLERHAKAIEEFAAKHGKGEPMTARVIAEKPEEFQVVFSPARREPAVAEVQFQGNQALPSSLLLNSFAGVAYGVPYRESRFLQMLDASLRPLYEARGRIRVQFQVLKTEPMTEVEGIRVVVKIDEGEVYKMGEGGIDGETPVAASELLRVLALKTDEIANFDEVNEGIERMRKRLRRDGYMQAAIAAERHIYDDRKTVDLTFRITPGPQFRLGELTILGLDINGQHAIRKLWKPKPGEPFNADYPDFFLKRIQEDGVFDDLGKTRAVLKVNEQERLVDVTLEFSAAPTEPDGKGPARGRRRRF